MIRASPALLSFCLALSAVWHDACVPASAQSTPANTLAIPLVKVSPPIDGNLSDPAWGPAAKVSLTRNLRDRSVSAEQTTVFVETDGAYLYVGFEARQHAPLSASQHTNDVGQGIDDLVSVYLWPSDAQGFFYSFSANPIGTHYQYSSETRPIRRLGFQPENRWQAATPSPFASRYMQYGARTRRRSGCSSSVRCALQTTTTSGPTIRQ
ncbi:MAG: hypothetical protein GIW98_03575 [Candidatus Eremiobacteraeota bacterium]|nr:hypothetical protein [Candidatus Eremiobacteraeota bacterium]